MYPLSNLLRRFIRQGTLRVRDADGKVHVFGERLPGPDVAIRLHDRKLYTRLFINPELYAAEAYMDGTLTLEDGAAIDDFLLLFSVNRAGLYSYGSQKLMRRVWRGLRRWHQANPIGLAAAHARHHYDISTELYRLFLDDQMQYSCAYFRDPEHETLEQAQRNKLIHATSKLRLKPGRTVAGSAPSRPASPFIWRANGRPCHCGQCFSRANQGSTHFCRGRGRFRSRRVSRVGLPPTDRTV